MNTKNCPSLGNNRTPDAAQLPLFPLDPWGAEHVVAVFDHPYSGIARAMLGPIVLGHPLDIADNPFNCLAVTEDGEFATRMSLHVAYFSDRGRLFQADRGRRFSAIVDAQRCAQARY